MFQVLITHLQEQLLRIEAVGITTCKVPNKNSVIKLDLKHIVYDARNHELEMNNSLNFSLQTNSTSTSAAQS
jgi:hypothetical protein